MHQPSTGESVAPGHNEVPIQSIVCTVRQLCVAMRVGAEDKTRILFDSLKWQVGNLHTLGHPYTSRVLDILGEHGYIHIEGEQQTLLKHQLTDNSDVVIRLSNLTFIIKNGTANSRSDEVISGEPIQ